MTFAEQWDDALPLAEMRKMAHAQHVLQMRPAEFTKHLQRILEGSRARRSEALALSVMPQEPK